MADIIARQNKTGIPSLPSSSAQHLLWFWSPVTLWGSSVVYGSKKSPLLNEIVCTQIYVRQVETKLPVCARGSTQRTYNVCWLLSTIRGAAFVALRACFYSRTKHKLTLPSRLSFVYLIFFSPSAALLIMMRTAIERDRFWAARCFACWVLLGLLTGTDVYRRVC